MLQLQTKFFSDSQNQAALTTNSTNLQSFNLPPSLASPNFPPSSLPASNHFHSSSITPFSFLSSTSDSSLNFNSISTNPSLVSHAEEPTNIPNELLRQSETITKEISPSFHNLHSPQDSLEKRPRSLKKPVPEEQKDERYKMKRAKNNEAAKRSRDCKRIKEFENEKKLLELSEELSRVADQILKMEERCHLMKMDLHRRLGVSFNNSNLY